jgi:pimeloyl-ACP methyl ester carboxylesterase
VATALVGVGLVLAVGLDGSPIWQVARIALAMAFTVVVLRVERRASNLARGRVATAVGVLAMAVGLGFAPHLAKGGPAPMRMASVLLLVGGLVLLVGGTVVALHGRRWLRTVGPAAGVVVLTAVVSPAIAATNVPRPELGATPADVGLTFVSLMVPTSDGVRLAAWYVPSRNGAAVVLLHGAGSTRSNVLDEAAVLADAGFGVLLVDARGHGESGGRAMDFGWFGEQDVAAAVEVLAAQPEVDADRLGVVGVSMGGEQALGASAAEPRIRAVVAEGATARSGADEAWLSEQFGVQGWFQEQLEWVQDRVTDVLTDAPFPVSSRAAVGSSDETRYLLITAGDVPDEAHAAAYVATADPDRVEVWTVPGGAHVGGLATAPGEWSDRVVGFLTDALPPAGR